MRAVIIYESMFGNTHAIADAIGKGLGPLDNVIVVPVVEAGRERLGDADLLVVGGPTHFHGMSRPRTRKWAAATAQKPKNDLVLDGDAQGPGVRDWLSSLGHGHTKVAAFDTRFTGRQSSEGRRRGPSAESFGSAGSNWWPSPRASSSPWRTTSNRARRPEPKNGANGWRQEFYRTTSPVGPVRDERPPPRRRDGQGDGPHPG